jgi:pyrimidine 5'-nucleotidase
MRPETEILSENEIEAKPKRTFHVIPMINGNAAKFKDLIRPVGHERVLLFDIDDCLYDAENGMQADEKRRLMELFEQLKVDRKNCPAFHEAYASTSLYQELFYLHLNIEPKKFWEIFTVPRFHEYIHEDAELREFLKSIPIRKWCFTNGNRERALSILTLLGITECFEGVFCADNHDMDFIGKPKSGSYKMVVETLGIKNPANVYFFDDALGNIVAARELGWNAYRVEPGVRIIDLVKGVSEIFANRTVSER